MARFKVVYGVLKQEIYYVGAVSSQQAIAKVEMDETLDSDESEEWVQAPYAEEVDDDAEE